MSCRVLVLPSAPGIPNYIPGTRIFFYTDLNLIATEPTHPLAELVEDVVVTLVVLLVNQAALLEQERQSSRATESPVLAIL